MLPFALQEPLRGISLVSSLHEYMNYSDLLLKVIPITADIFVFLFPILLIAIYIIGLIKKNDTKKEYALRIFWSAILTSATNIFVQFFFEKERPSILLFGDSGSETILHKFLPNSSFPSDHAAMSMGFAMGLLIRGIKNKDKKYILLGIAFLIFSLIMGFSRIMVGVHRPTDIIGGFLIGIIIPLILSRNCVYKILKKILIDPLIKLQKLIIKR